MKWLKNQPEMKFNQEQSKIGYLTILLFVTSFPIISLNKKDLKKTIRREIEPKFLFSSKSHLQWQT